MKPICIALSATGGRHPMTLGILDVLEPMLHRLGYEPFRIGSSGGTMAGVVRALTPPEESSVWWLEKAVKMAAGAKIGGVRLPLNLYWLLMYGGLLRSENLIKMMEQVMEGPFINGRVASCTFSVTSKCEIRIELDQKTMSPRQIAEWIVASASLPLAVSPTEILNKTMPEWVQKKTGVEEYPEGFSAWGDGGIGSYCPVSLRGLHWNVPVGTPVIGVCLDPVASAYNPTGLVGSALQGTKFWTKIWNSCWSAVAANTLEDWEKATRDAPDHPAFMLSIPTPKNLKAYQLKLNTSLDEAMEMYEYGVAEAKHRLQMKLPGTTKTLEETLKSLPR